MAKDYLTQPMTKICGNYLSRPAFLEIDLENVKFNVCSIRKRLGEKIEFLAVVKADAYGHGAYKISQVVLENGADLLGVAILEEGIELREKGIKAPILILYPEFVGREEKILEYDLESTVLDYDFAQNLSLKAAKQKKMANVYIKVDTGMGRYGLAPDEAYRFVKEIRDLDNIKIKGILSQLSSAEEKEDEFTFKQISNFKKVLEQLENFNRGFLNKSIANSSAVLNLPESYFNQVRVGLLIYGIYPSLEVSKSIRVKPVLSFKSKILFLKEVEKGTPIGYSRSYITPRKTKVATIPLGYADGFGRLLSNKAYVLIHGKRAKVIGRVCMDAFMVDVTDIPEAKAGDELVLIGKQGDEEITVDEFAEWNQSINYEVITRMGKRLPKVYLKNE
ncbi:MAG: alanine racemase [Candidatus Zixiibacteriota bacterium]